MANLKTTLSLRPFARFDPADAEHRRYFRDFLRDNSWKDCPLRFLIEDYSENVVYYIHKKLLDYYISKEFDVVKKPRNVVKKPQILRKKAPKNG